MAKQRIQPPKVQKSKRRNANFYRRLAVPAGESPGVWWAKQRNMGGQTRLNELLAEIAEYCDIEFQLAIELADEGEPTPTQGGDMGEFLKEPWQAVIWIGSPQVASDVLKQLLNDDMVGGSLCRGARLRLTSWGNDDLDAHRSVVDSIQTSLVTPPLPQFAPWTDRVIQQARRIANSQSKPSEIRRAFSGDSTPATDTATQWPPDDGWHVRQGEFAFRGTRYEVGGIHWRVVNTFVATRVPLTKKMLFARVWQENNPEDSTFSSTLTAVRNFLRKALKLPADLNPLPGKNTGEAVAWRLDREGIEKALDGTRRSRPS